MRPPAVNMRRMATSDHPFKLIHADPRMVEDTLRGFIAPSWADRLDFDTLAPLEKERVGPALRSRIGDKAWRVERRDGAPLADGRRPYLLILLEFQSEMDADMAWRMLEYLYLLELNQRDIGLHRKEGCAPDFLAVVIHNGAKPWSATATRFGPLLGPPTEAGRALNRWQAYVVIDYPTLAGDHAFMDRLPPGNRQAALLRLESAPSSKLPKLLVEALRRWSGPESAGLRRGFHARAEHLLRRQGLALPPLADYERMLAQEQGAREMTTLMEARLQEWHDSAIAQGVQQGRQQGMQQGMQQGRQQGMQQGMQQGVQQGQKDLLHRLAERRFDAETARRLSGLLDGADADRLIEVGDWVVDCASGDELLDRVGQASP